ncbi:hypothetical protein [Teichococcus rhizosphaerae]|uniref:hypothetical protein n=1 Tax=Teichococcus rhizosphaerae TaxID=1335062 RepID=UPI001C3F43D4|nr:hypothetical protein [Pseudoroseomonas rhizosphaerae]
MTLRLDGGTLHLEGDCGSEEAEPLLALLLEEPSRAVSLAGARTLHTALVQVLLALRPPLAGLPAEPFLRRWVAPLLDDVPLSEGPTLVQDLPLAPPRPAPPGWAGNS